MKYYYENASESNHFCFISCFVTEKIGNKENKDEAVNSLNLWRNYAKGDNREEAAGVKIVLPLTFFPSSVDLLKSLSENKNYSINETLKSLDDKNHDNNLISIPEKRAGFFKVRYGKKDIEKFENQVHEIVNELKISIEKIKKIRKIKNTIDKNNIIEELKSCVRIMTFELKYLFKSAFYKSEEEYRRLAIIQKESESINLDKKSNKLYIEIDNDLFSQPNTKIFLGTNMKDAKIQKPRLEHSLAKRGNNNCTVAISKLPFREIERSTNRNEIDIKATLSKAADSKK